MEERRNEIRTSPKRLIALAVVLVLVFSAFSVRLYRIQIVDHEKYAAQAQGGAELTLPITAARGEILDRDLSPLVVNTTAYAVVFDYNYFPVGTGEEARARQNAIILELATLLRGRGEEWNDTLPITAAPPYAFEEGREQSVAALKKSLRLADYATAENCMAALVRNYCLQEHTAAEQRLLAGVQYEMTVREFTAFNAYTFAAGVSKETSYLISENPDRYPGVDIQTTAVRDYVCGTTAAHLIGTVGPMYAEDYAALKDQGYALNDTLGKSGVEAAFESALRGKAGKRVLKKNSAGAVVSATETVSPIPGNRVVLTLDKTLQDAAQGALQEKIEQLRALSHSSYNGHDVTSGSVVLLDVSDGGVLAAASWPGYDLSTYTAQYNELLKDPDKPLFNRALYGAFACGSTMKPAVALAALTEGVITPATTRHCTYAYNRFSSSGLVLHCMGRHGSLGTVTALEKSCNIFFYDVGIALGIDKLNTYSAAFGLGQRTGIEIGEAQGVLAGPAHSSAVGKIWSAADTAGASIGQSDNMFTPIQLATYAMTVANNGVRYKTHLLHSKLSYDGRVVETAKPEVAAEIALSPEAIDTVRRGMVAAAKSGTASYYFRSTPYSVACKTGTAQVSNVKSDHGVFIAYAPAEKPEVAIAVVMENGTSGASTWVARQVLDAYFSISADTEADTHFGVLLP